MKDTKLIRRDFYSVASVMPQGWDFGALGVPRWSFFFQTWSCGISNWRGWRAEQNASKFFILGSNWWPWVRSKVKYHLISVTKSISKIFLYQICVCSHKWKVQNISDGIFILLPGSCPRAGTFGHWGRRWGQFAFSNMVMWQYQIDGDDEQNRI